MYGIEPFFWLKLIFLLAIVTLFLVLFNTVMRKLYNIERKKFFSPHIVNEKHKKIDRLIRLTTIVSLLLGFIITIISDTQDWHWFLQPWFILLISIFVSETVEAIMERKYSENPNAYKLTISQIIFYLILFFILFKTDFFGIV
ncbi:MAG: DUF4181 domain-containing protein [Anaerobacillus sp.]